METCGPSRSEKEALATTAAADPRRGQVGADAAQAALRYRAYGLTLRSTLPLPCRLARSRGGCHAEIIQEESLGGSSLAADRSHRGRPARFACRRLSDGTAHVTCPGLFEFLISPDGRRIICRRRSDLALESLHAYLFGQALSFSLVAFGLEPLHATAVALGGRGVAFLGDCGYGKSTLGAAFVARGFPLVTDDLLVLARKGRRWWMEPGIPRMKLHASALGMLPGCRMGAIPMLPGADKLVVPLAPRQAVRRPVQLAGLFVLPSPRRSEGRKSQVAVTGLSAREACLEILRAAFNLVVCDPRRLRRQFAFAVRMATTVPVWRLEYPRSLAALPRVCEAVVASLDRYSR